jgi:hypothetical protein
MTARRCSRLGAARREAAELVVGEAVVVEPAPAITSTSAAMTTCSRLSSTPTAQKVHLECHQGRQARVRPAAAWGLPREEKHPLVIGSALLTLVLRMWQHTVLREGSQLPTRINYVFVFFSFVVECVFVDCVLVD